MDNNGVHFMMPTVFNDEDSIDIKSMHNICEFAKKSGCKGLVLLGVMGEAHRLSEHERNFLIEEISQLSKELGLILQLVLAQKAVILQQVMQLQLQNLEQNKLW